MGKYRLQARKKDALITVLEVDTESRAWHLKADNKEAAIKSLAEMSEELKGIESFFVNGEDVTSYVFSQKENLNEKKKAHRFLNYRK